MKRTRILIISALLLSPLAVLAKGEKTDGEKKDGATGLAGLVKIDEWNELVKDKAKGDGEPCRGGQLRLGFIQDPKSTQPIIDNDQPTRMVQEYLSDAVIDRDRETFEWLPFLARYWKTRDLVFVKEKDGKPKRLEGRVVSEDADKLVFSEGTSKWTIARCDADVDEASGKVRWKKDRPGGPIADGGIEGKISTWPGGRYTWYVEETPKKTIEIKRSEIATIEEEVDGVKSTVEGIQREVVWDVALRSGVKWHDGEPLTVEDVLFTYDTIMNPSVLSGPLKSYLEEIRKIEKTGDLAFRTEFKRQYFGAIGTVGQNLGSYLIAKHRYSPEKFAGDPKGFGEAFNRHAENEHYCGTGPYRFSKWEHGKLLEIVRNDDWWGSKAQVPWIKPLQPYLDKITWVIIANKNARLKALARGEIDADFEVEQSDWLSPDYNTDEFKSKFVRAKFLSAMYTYIGWNLRRPAGDTSPMFFMDKRVRLAMSMLIDRKKILKNIHGDLGELTVGPCFLHGPHADPAIEPIEYNPEKAKALLAEAGWIDHDGDGIRDKNGVKFEFTYNIHNAKDYHAKVADIVKQDIEKAGIKMNIKVTDFNNFIEVVNSRKFDAVRFAWGEPDCVDTDLYQIWHSSQWDNNGSNHTGYANKEVDEILEKNRRELDFKKRQRLMKKFYRIVADDQPYTFLFYLYELYMYSNKYRNVKLTIIGNEPYNLLEWYVPKELQGE